jgi:hypothetical protein
VCALLLLDLECVLKASYTRTKDENTFYREHILLLDLMCVLKASSYTWVVSILMLR